MKGKQWVVTAAVLVAGIRMWSQVRGTTKTPFSEWAVGWVALFFFLALMAEWSESAAAGLAGTVVIGDFLVNGASLFEDLSGLASGVETGTILTPEPFAASTSSGSGQTRSGQTYSADGLHVSGSSSTPTPAAGSRGSGQTYSADGLLTAAGLGAWSSLG